MKCFTVSLILIIRCCKGSDVLFFLCDLLYGSAMQRFWIPVFACDLFAEIALIRFWWSDFLM